MLRSSKWFIIAVALVIGGAGTFAALQQTVRLGQSVSGLRSGLRYVRVIRALLGDPDLQQKLNLTPDQIDRIRRIATAGFEEVARLRGEVVAQKIALRALVADPDASRESIQEQANELSAAVQALANQITTTLLDVRDVLTPDQRRILLGEIRARWGSLRQAPLQRRPRAAFPAPDSDDPDAMDDTDSGGRMGE